MDSMFASLCSPADEMNISEVAADRMVEWIEHHMPDIYNTVNMWGPATVSAANEVIVHPTSEIMNFVGNDLKKMVIGYVKEYLN